MSVKANLKNYQELYKKHKSLIDDNGLTEAIELIDDSKSLYDDDKEIKSMVDESLDALNFLFEKKIKSSAPSPSKKKGESKNVKSADTPKNLSQLKQWLKNNINHYLYCDTLAPNLSGKRKILHVQTNSVQLSQLYNKEGSWLELNKASDFTFHDTYFSIDSFDGEIKYFYIESDYLKQKKGKSTAKKSVTPKKKSTPACSNKNRTLVFAFSDDLKLIRRFKTFIGKEKNKKQFLSLFRAFERAITEKKIDKNSPYKETINTIHSALTKVINDLEKEQDLAQIYVKNDFEETILKLTNQTSIRTSVRLLKRFITVEGGDFLGNIKRLETLRNAFESALSKGKVCEGDIYYKEVHNAKKSLIKAIENGGKVSISKQELNGLNGICNCNTQLN
ncbi:hypothetical protein [Flammeovirga sp. EKP202]|uniref:hypothetical protein n=1 Tax=Flammeovirga sp. EKP202 TaxID=2770592 RepID=UPI00165F1507|nr:hypothetical protein [Flammeovirga sp. EKP202]MBD0403228.1 hypothetical protein [Flammeovirga sp. EKP202]